MSRWLRLYDDTINDPKILKLPEATRWHWIALLCVTSKNEGVLPPLDDIAIQLRITPAKATEIIAGLVKAGLLDKLETGFAPHNWNGRQYKSDVSTDRVKRFRNGKRNVSETADETEVKRPQIQSTETDTEKKDIAPSARDLAFEEFWKVYPRRDGANPKEPAAKIFLAAVKAGAISADIIAGAKRCCEVEAKNVGTPYIPQAVKWLRDKRWLDYPAVIVEVVSPDLDWEGQIKRFKQGYQWSTKWYGPEPGAIGCKAPADLLAKHGLGVSEVGIPISTALQSMQ